MKRKSIKKGLPPGSLIHIGSLNKEKTKIQLISYNSRVLKSEIFNDVDTAITNISKSKITWINIVGVQDSVVINKLGDRYKLHPLILEDIMNTEQRTKIEFYDDCIFFTIKLLYRVNREIKSEEVSLILLNNTVLSFLETSKEIFEPIKNRIIENIGIIRKQSADYLFYSLIDIIIDNYFSVIEDVEEQTERLEKMFIAKNTEGILKNIKINKYDILFLRKAITPLGKEIQKIRRGGHKLLNDNNIIFFNDVYDHIIQMVESLYIYSELNISLQETYHSLLSERTNKTIQLLTIISTIFIPLTFIVGVYGMNFKHMPGLTLSYGFYIILGAMIIVAFSMIIYFKRKKWF
ncbi:MAG: magnesium/cobalt transporter CorA [Candidatus Lokiarchaeota archaeon]|nr:magnesium/cobalt transporter CorA [Candidatus Lokiarchaeota archaeon]